MASQKVSKSSYYSKHIIQSEGDLELENPATIIKSEAVAEDFDSGSLQVNGGVSIKKNLLVDGPVSISGPLVNETLTVTGPATMSSLDVENIDVDNLVINESVTFSDGEIYIRNLKTGSLSSLNLTLRDQKYITFSEDEYYRNNRHFSWHAFTFSNTTVRSGLHPYSSMILQDSSSKDITYTGNAIMDDRSFSLSALPSIYNHATINEEGVCAPYLKQFGGVGDVNSEVEVLLELPLNAHYPGAGASLDLTDDNSQPAILLESVSFWFKDKSGFSDLTGISDFVTVEASVVRRPVLLGIPGSQEVVKTLQITQSEFLDNQISAHTLTLDDPISMTSNFSSGNILTIRISIRNLTSNFNTSFKDSPTFIGANVSCRVFKITPS